MYINHFLKAWLLRASIQFHVSWVSLKIAWFPLSQNYLCSISTQETFKRSRSRVQKQPFANVIKNMFLKFRNIHSKISVLGSLFNKVAELQACNFIKKWLQHRCFPVNTANLLRTFYTEHLQWLVLQVFYKECCSQKFYKLHYKISSSESFSIKIQA